MGRAEILTNLGAGRYRVRVEYETTRVDALVARLQADSAQLATQLPTLLGAWNTALAALSDAADALDAAIQTGDVSAIRSAETQLIAAQAEAARREGAYRQVQLRKVALDRRVATLQTIVPTDPVEDVWCADYNLGLSGLVGTIEVARGSTRGVWIRPGGAAGTEAGWQQSRDGLLRPSGAMIAAEAFHAYAILPGLAKWRPRFRVGTVTAVNASGTLEVDLDAVAIGHQRLGANQTGALSDVAVEYMGATVAGAVFVAGDRVLVEFRPAGGASTWWGVPYVIGFAEGPKAVGFIVTGPSKVYDGAVFVASGLETPYDWLVKTNVDGAVRLPFVLPTSPFLGKAQATITVVERTTYAERVRIDWPSECVGFETVGQPDEWGQLNGVEDWDDVAGPVPRYHWPGYLEVRVDGGLKHQREVFLPMGTHSGDDLGDPDATFGPYTEATWPGTAPVWNLADWWDAPTAALPGTAGSSGGRGWEWGGGDVPNRHVWVTPWREFNAGRGDYDYFWRVWWDSTYTFTPPVGWP